MVWASGARGRVERTTDGGVTWQTDTVSAGAKRKLDFRGIAALDERTAFAMAGQGKPEQGQAKIFETTDGGTTWTLVYSTDMKGVFLDALSFWDAKHGIAMSDPIDGKKLYLLRTDDEVGTRGRISPPMHSPRCCLTKRRSPQVEPA